MTLGDIKAEADKLDRKAIELYREYNQVRETAKQIRAIYETELAAARARYNALPRIKRNINVKKTNHE